MNFRLLLFGFVLASCFHCATAEELSVSDLNDATALLAGLEPPHQTDHPLSGSSSWKNHASQMQREFDSHRERVLHPMSAWSNEELPSYLVQGSVVRYLFSGPDIIHAFHMFPSAETFILCGLEPVGEIPDLDQLNTGNAGRALGEVRNALGEIINFSFFRTKDMKEDLRFATFHGTTPIMMIFLAQSGQYIKSVEFLTLNQDGTLTSQGSKSSGADAVKIEFSPRRINQNKTLYYFCSDLSDNGFPKSGFQTWLENYPDGNAYLKAASFLMHENWFKAVRQHLLDHSHQIVQDDSGIPFRFFKHDVWYADLFGTYTGPIDLFSQHYQGDLRATYRARDKQPLAFGTGYKWRKGESNLMRFVKQDAPVEAEVAGETTPDTVSTSESTSPDSKKEPEPPKTAEKETPPVDSDSGSESPEAAE